MDVFLPEVIQTEGEETVICEEDIEQMEPATGNDDSAAEESSADRKYVKLCV